MGVLVVVGAGVCVAVAVAVDGADAVAVAVGRGVAVAVAVNVAVAGEVFARSRRCRGCCGWRTRAVVNGVQAHRRQTPYPPRAHQDQSLR